MSEDLNLHPPNISAFLHFSGDSDGGAAQHVHKLAEEGARGDSVRESLPECDHDESDWSRHHQQTLHTQSAGRQ